MRAFALTIAICCTAVAGAAGRRVNLPAGALAPGDADLGPVPASQMLTLTVWLKPEAAREAELNDEIAAQQTAGSAEYRRWVTPEEFAARFGATEEQVASVSDWLESEGLEIEAVSAGKTRLTVAGSVARVQAAFGVELRRYSSAGTVFFASSMAASVPAEMGGSIAGISGLDDRPAANPMTVKALSAGGAALPAAAGANALTEIEAAVDANAAWILTVHSTACRAEFGQADAEAWRAALRQAEVQGITVLVTSACEVGGRESGARGSFPANLAELAAVADRNASDPTQFDETPNPIHFEETSNPTHRMEQERNGWGTQFDETPNPIRLDGKSEDIPGNTARPSWQFAEGLPADGFRDEPDVTADVVALARTLAGISQKAGTRLGNVAPALYALAKTPELYTQPDGAAAGRWERGTGLGVVDLKVLADEFPRGTIGTSSLLVPSNYAPYHGKTLTLTATVTSTGGSGIPTGMVTFTGTQKGTLGTEMLDGTGKATFSSDSLQAGTYTLTAVYAGDATYTGSTSGIATVTILGELSLITATVEPGAAVGGNATIDVSITSASGVGTPSGTVTAAPQGTMNAATASATLAGTNGTATAKVSLPVYEAGQFTVLVSCSDPDPSFTCYSPISIQMTVAKGVSTTTVVSAPATPAVGEPYTLTATVSSGVATAAARSGAGAMLARRNAKAGVHAAAASTAETPTGSVQFLDGTTVLATHSLASGTAAYSGTATSATHQFSAAYSGDQNYATSNSSSPTATTGGLPTSTSLTASSYAINVGQAITFYSTVFSPGVASTMTGTVTYSAAAQGVLGSGTVSGGLATLTLTGLPAGTYTMTATYSGDGTFAGSTSTSMVVVTVTAVMATISGTISPSPLPYGYNASLMATVSFPAGVTTPPAGTLQAVVTGVAGDSFTQPLVAAVAGPSATATFTFPAPTPGRYSVVLSCPATDTFPCSPPVTIPMTVVQGLTATALSLDPPAPLAGQKTRLTATISNLGNNPAAYTFTGSVQFLVNNKLVGTSAVSGSTASVEVALPAGPAQSIVAVYSGDTNWNSSTSAPITVSVAALLTATTLTSNVSEVIAGVQVVLTATVTGTASGVIAETAPSGLVDFYDTSGGVLSKLGSSKLASLGANASVATFNATGLAAGTHVIYAVFEGDLVYSGSTSGTLTLGFTNFAVSFVPATMTIKQGQTGSATLLVNFQGGFAGSVAFGCTPPPNVEVTCSFNPAVIQAGGTTTLSVATVAPSARPGGEQAGLMRRFGGAVLALLLLWAGPPRHRIRLGSLLVLLAIGASSITGCTGSNGSVPNGGTAAPPVTTPSNPGSSLGTQILTITTAGSDGTNTVRHDYQYQVTVQ